MRANFHIGVTGGTSLLGKELGDALRDAALGGPARLLKLESDGESNSGEAMARALVEYGDEPTVTVALTREALDGLDTLFLAGSAEESLWAWELAQGERIRVIDVSGTLASTPGAVTAGWNGAPAARLVVVAHPAAQALERLLGALHRAGRLDTAAAVVFEPVSQRGWEGIQELEQQSVKLLSLQSQPREVFDAQVAFNLKIELGADARPSLGQMRRRIEQELKPLLAASGGPAVAVELVQVPVFHSTAVSLYVRFENDPGRDAVISALSIPEIELAGAGDEPDPVSAAGQAAMQISMPRAEAGPQGGYWMFATLDNLRRSALSAVASATAGLDRA